MKEQKICIIGNGIAGVTAARQLRKRDSRAEIQLISGETDHFFSRTALMYIYMGHMRYEHTKPYEDSFWLKNRISLTRAWVQRIDPVAKTLVLDDGQEVRWDVLILACGSAPNKFGWPGQDLPGVQGLYSYQDLQSMERDTVGIRQAVVVGGGLIGIEMAEMLHSRGIRVTFLVREQSYWDAVLPSEESQMVNRHIRENEIDLRLGAELESIEAGENGRVAAVLTKTGERIDCQFVGLTVGVHPNIGWLEGAGIETQRGILVNDYFQTNHQDVYAIGDCAQLPDWPNGRPRLEQLWYTGKMHGEAVAENILGRPQPYERGIWYNSAKFFDIEYQTYGQVPAKIEAPLASLYWEHQDGRRAIRIVYDPNNNDAVTGFNTLGIRYRQAVCQRWICDRAPLATVLSELGEANCDPEFFEQCEAALVSQYNQRTNQAVQLKKKRGLFSALQFRFKHFAQQSKAPATSKEVSA